MLTNSSTHPHLTEAVTELFTHFEGSDLTWHLRDLLRMAVTSPDYAAMPHPERVHFTNLTHILTDCLASVTDAHYDSVRDAQGGEAVPSA